MGRSPCCSKVGLRRGPWSTKEDTLLTNYIQEHGEGQWRALPKNAGLLRCGKSCRLRWMNYLRPGIKRGNITQDEEDLIVRLHKLLGNRWSLIAGRLPGRTDNEIKNYWNTYLLKKLKTSGITPTTTTKSSPTKIKKKSTTVKKNNNKKIKKNKNVVETISTSKVLAVEQQHNINQENHDDDDADVPKTKILYVPKAIRVSSSFTRSNSYDSLNSGGSSNSSTGGGGVDVDVAADVLMPLFEMDKLEEDDEEEEMNYDFLSDDCDMLQPVLQHHHQQHFTDLLSTDVNMWEKVYDEYLQLL